MLLNWGRSRGLFTDNSRARLYQGCAGELGVVRIHPPALLWPLIKLSLSLKIGEKHTVAPDVSNSVGNHLLLSCVDLFSTTVNMVSDGMLLMQKDPTLGIITLNRFLGILLVFQKRDSSHSLESWKFLEAQSALTFNLPSRYSTVSMISLGIVNSQISLEMVIISFYPPLNIFENVKRASLMANNSRTLIWRFDPWRVHWPPVDTFWQYAPNHFWRHRIALLFWRLEHN